MMLARNERMIQAQILCVLVYVVGHCSSSIGRILEQTPEMEEIHGSFIPETGAGFMVLGGVGAQLM